MSLYTEVYQVFVIKFYTFAVTLFSWKWIIIYKSTIRDLTMLIFVVMS